MAELKAPVVPISADLIGAIKAMPHHRDVQHCGVTFAVSPFDMYATCPHCGQQIKVRSLAAVVELEDVFDAVFEWMLHEDGDDVVGQRQKAIRDNLEE